MVLKLSQIICGGAMLAVLLFACGCGDDPNPADLVDAAPFFDAERGDAGPFVCNVTAPTSCAMPAPTYADVEPIFQQRCVGCHNGSSDLWSLKTYNHAADWFDLVPPEIVTCRMPPPEAGVQITEDERRLLLNWYRCGFLK